jgi:hypothetical protein
LESVLPDYDWVSPFCWKLDGDVVYRHLAAHGLIPYKLNSVAGQAVTPRQNIRIVDAMKQYLADQEARVGRGDGKGLKIRSFNIK